jgi:hypothetical protein
VTERPRDRPAEEGELLPGLNSVPAVARIAAGAWYQGAVWGAGTALKVTERLTEAAVSPRAAAALIGEVGGTVGGLARILGHAGEGVAEEAGVTRRQPEPSRNGSDPDPSAQSLRERGAELLERAAAIQDGRDPVHPGFARIIDQLAPDEARILKLLVNHGAQGIVYVNKAAPFGIGATEIARRLSMIGTEAGCLHSELVPAYLDSLVSHGLVAIRRDALEDELPYQVIEAQPEVTEALSRAGGKVFRGQITRRSVHLTDFGRTFCQVCFPPEHLTGEFGAIEVERAPDIAAVAPPPEPAVD